MSAPEARDAYTCGYDDGYRAAWREAALLRAPVAACPDCRHAEDDHSDESGCRIDHCVCHFGESELRASSATI